jgi:hypothetical protein
MLSSLDARRLLKSTRLDGVPLPRGAVYTPLITWVRSLSSCAAFRSWDCFLHCMRNVSGLFFALKIREDVAETGEPPGKRVKTYVFQSVALVVLE